MEHASRLSPEVLLRHEEFVLRLARTLVRGEADAEEVAQRTLVSAVEHPPRHGALRAWLVRVTKNHATELHRTERRRTAREQRVARPEAVAAEGSAMERLELEHGVVRAVLSLDEPYKSVVVAVYYEGLAPAEIAARNGVPAGTVRSQLTRAHEMLRAKLDRTHGERATWMSGLTGLLALRDVPSGAAVASAGTASSAASSSGTTVGGSNLVGPILVGAGVAACIALVFVVRAAIAPPSAPEIVAVEPIRAALSALASEGDDSPATSGRHVAVAAVVPDEVTLESAVFVPSDEPKKLLEQSRQIKKLILDRRLAVTPEERQRAGIATDTETSGVVHLLDRSRFGMKYSLPWMREGGAYYSFTERVHDFNRTPQIQLQDGWLSANSFSLVLDLGPRRLSSVPTTASVRPGGLTPEDEITWDTAWATRITTTEQFTTTWERIATQSGVRATLRNRPEFHGVRPRIGHSYLVRTADQDHDLTVALEVIAFGDGSCTLGWRLLESRPLPAQSNPWLPTMQASELPNPSPALTSLAEKELVALLDVVREKAAAVILDRFTPEIEREYGPWRDDADRGLIRLVPYMSDWSELMPGFFQGAGYSFDERRYDADDEQIGTNGDWITPALSGGGYGAVVDLGSAPLERLDIAAIAALGGRPGELAAEHEFEHISKAQMQNDRAAAQKAHADMQAFQQLASGPRGRDGSIRVDGTYAVRSARPATHDVLVAVRVLAKDKFGTVLAWRMIRRWPIPQ